MGRARLDNSRQARRLLGDMRFRAAGRRVAVRSPDRGDFFRLALAHLAPITSIGAWCVGRKDMLTPINGAGAYFARRATRRPRQPLQLRQRRPHRAARRGQPGSQRLAGYDRIIPPRRRAPRPAPRRNSRYSLDEAHSGPDLCGIGAFVLFRPGDGKEQGCSLY